MQDVPRGKENDTTRRAHRGSRRVASQPRLVPCDVQSGVSADDHSAPPVDIVFRRRLFRHAVEPYEAPAGEAADTGTPRQGGPVERPLGGQCPAEYAVSYQPEDGRNYGEGLGRRPSVLRVENAFLPETSSGPAGRRGSERDSRTHAEAQEDRRSEQTD